MQHVDDGRLHACLDGELAAYGEATAQETRQHLAGCVECRARLSAAAQLRDRSAAILRQAEPREIPLPPFSSIEARAPFPPPRSTGRRFPRELAWAATLVLALGAGWFAREALAPAAPRFAATEAAPGEESAPAVASLDAEAGAVTEAAQIPNLPAPPSSAAADATPEPAAPPALARAAERALARTRGSEDVVQDMKAPRPDIQENLIIRPPQVAARAAAPGAPPPAAAEALALSDAAAAGEANTTARFRSNWPAVAPLTAEATMAAPAPQPYDATALATLGAAWAEDFLTGATRVRPARLRADPRVLADAAAGPAPAWSGTHSEPVLAALRARPGISLEPVDALAACVARPAECAAAPGEAAYALGAADVQGDSASVPIRVWWVTADGESVRTHATTLRLERRNGQWVINPPDLVPR